MSKYIEQLVDCKRSEWNPTILPEFDQTIVSVGVYVSLVWKLKQALVTQDQSNIIPYKMRNLHRINHLRMYIELYGSLNHLDTGTYESYHKVATTNIYQGTSKRYNGLFLEMINGILLCDYNRLVNNVEKIVNQGDQFAKNIRLKKLIDGVVFHRIMNTKKYTMMIFYDSTNFIVDEEDWDAVCKQQVLDSSNKLRQFLFSNDIGNSITHYFPHI